MSNLRKSVTVCVPATTANMGPGFDSIGMALDIWNEMTVEQSDEQLIIVSGEGEASLPRDDSNLVVIGMKAAFKISEKLAKDGSSEVLGEACKMICSEDYSDVKLPPLKYTCTNRIPFARGLGSSSAAVVAGLLAGLVLLRIELPVTGEEALLNIACAIEGHPDNVAPAIYGGLQIGVKFLDRDSPQTSIENCQQQLYRWTSSRVAVPNGLQCVLFLPDKITETAKARAILPKHISRGDAIFNLSRSALLINSLATGAFHQLKIAMEDALHQPHRAAEQAAHLYPLISAAVGAGAHSACLSGAGPAVLALTSGSKGDVFTQKQAERMDRAVADAMLKAAKSVKIAGRIFITHPTQKGAHVTSADPPFSEGPLCLFGGGGHI